ncbi:MAG: NAD(P)/FAD-dependent oxidoreductase, partial [Erysipelotrichaceae bacterium]|nr:NAD(P)/FAD-dependent oxidoreductase [Erysipelotrichaceae bacterium]
VDALKQLGIQTKWLNDLLYPRSEQAKTVRDVLMAHVEKLGIKVLTQTPILSIAYHRHTYHITTDKQTFKSDGLILTMGTVAGGLSYGCDRAFVLSPLYLNIRDYEPMLTKMVTKENLKSLKGTRVKGRITLKKDDHTLAVEDGELLFTNYGVSGIAVMNLSRDYVPGCTLHIDMMPDITLSELKEMIISSPLDEPLTGLLPGELTKYFIKHHFDYPIIKNMTLHIVELKGASDAQVMKGGITLNQLNDHLEFKNYPHLYAAGEILDVTGLCGGYNLHFAFASAARVAEGIIDELKEDVT